MTIVLIDDTRSFTDARDCITFRHAEDAVKFLSTVKRVDELWLDFVLAGSESITDVLFPLIRAKDRGEHVAEVKRALYHSSSHAGYSLVMTLCADLGWPKPERVFHGDHMHEE